MVMVVFQHLAKGQPLQPDSTCPPARFGRFQSLYRGTAFATITTKENIMAIKKSTVAVFQSLYRGTAFATDLNRTEWFGYDVFQSLYRGTAFATETLQKP